MTCHSGVNIGGDKYEMFGKVQSPGPDIRPPDDVGRADVTGRDADKYFFRVAPLRNIALTAPYFHSGVVWDLGEAVKVMAKAQLGNELSDADEPVSCHRPDLAARFQEFGIIRSANHARCALLTGIPQMAPPNRRQ